MTSLNHQFENDFSSSDSEERTVELSNRWLDRLSVEKKLRFAVLGNTLVLAFLVSLILCAAWFFTETGREHSISNAVEARSNNAVVALYDAVESVDAAEDARSQIRRDEALLQSNEALILAVALLNEPIAQASASLPQDYSQTYIGLRDDVQALQSRADAARGTTATLAELRGEIIETKNDLKDFTAFLRTRMKSSTAALFGEITTFLLVLVIISAGCIAGSIFGARRIASSVSAKIKKLTSTMEKIVEGDTSIEIPSRHRQDEIGGMARALEVFRRSSLELSELTQRRAAEVEEQLAQQQYTSDEMRALRQQKSQLLEDLAKGFEVSVGELITSVSAASEQLKATSAQMVKVADGSNEQADSASAAMKSASSNVTAAAAATDEFALSINEISQQATASATLARDATALVASANTRMDDLSSAAEEVGEIAGLIQTIAQRTNLLALNASIEAARGGEAGRGFAVVASEVKELAMQTSAATSSVAEKITAMQDSTRSSAGDLTSIYDQIGELEKVAVVIATAVDQQSVSGEELARNIDTVAEGSRQVSERLVALREASEETGSAAGDVVASANALGTHANDLREKAGRFIADVRKSARELEADCEAA
ncbi:methyl-accepting chemotaxis protein [uncultured Erythrobacter sp.]|uniref:methyl-accepting chemotaxis protein n=1 Tax=uncultured Erythrobacter sp. TaxID=263913 RepID=UPI002614D99A|nr:HAMP domain-containing methyl-accepting chemotaxis protein [uncultured Erythrobacter sp.]